MPAPTPASTALTPSLSPAPMPVPTPASTALTPSPSPAPMTAPTPAPTDNVDAKSQCEFDDEPIDVGFYWDPTCQMGDLGCDGDGKHVECRLCGGGNYISIPCPA